jgi:type III restriction enzyme
MARAKKAAPGPAASQSSFAGSEAELRTAVCVPAIRSEVAQWLASGDYPGVTTTTRTLLHHWFHTDHRRRNRAPFKYHPAQRAAMETLVYLHEVAGIRSQRAMYERFAMAGENVRLPLIDAFPRLGVKMATGSGKTKVMSLAIAWHYFNSVLEGHPGFATTFLLIAPNVIVLERLKKDFASGRVFKFDPVIPRELEVHWDFECYMRGEGERAGSTGALYVTNVHQLYDRQSRVSAMPDAMAGVMGSDPKATPTAADNFAERAARRGRVVVLNDEAHHTHQDNQWMRAVYGLHTAAGLAQQLDFTATPRFQDGTLFPWTAFDYPLARAIEDGIVKRPLKGVVSFEEVRSTHAPTAYAGFLTAGVERWKEYRDGFAPVGKRPILFIMLSSTAEVDDVVEWLGKEYSDDFAGNKTLPIHVNLKNDEGGGITQKDLQKARAFAGSVDNDESPVNAVVSVLMLREGWDVSNVTVVVGLRPYSAKADILPEQTIGRGLRLMFPGQDGYEERVDIIGNKAFLDFVEELEKSEGVSFGVFDPATERFHAETIAPVSGREIWDIYIPELSRAVIRRQDLGVVIAGLDLGALAFQPLWPAEAGLAEKMHFEAYDILTSDLQLERDYIRPEPQTVEEIIAYFAQRILRDIRAPGQFEPMATKLREFFATWAFGGPVDLTGPRYWQAMGRTEAAERVVANFVDALRPHILAQQEVSVQTPGRSLYTTPPFSWSKPLYEAKRSVFNFEGCDNEFEHTFARWLDHTSDGRAFCKLPRGFGFSIEYADVAGNLRLYYPDFVAVGADGRHWLIETKGQEDVNVTLKDRAAELWCRNATELGLGVWRYVKVRQKDFEGSEPRSLGELSISAPKPLV